MLRYLFYTLSIGYLLFSTIGVNATYTMSSNVFLFGSGNSGQNGIISFSYSPTLSWTAPINPTYIDPLFHFHGNVWIDSVGWSTFDHTVVGSEVKINDSTCVSDTSKNACTLTGYLWSKNAGWIRFSGNNGAGDVEFYRPTMTLSGFAWNNQVGWINVSGITTLLGPIIPIFTGATNIGDNYAMSTTGSTSISISIPPALSSLPQPIRLRICLLTGGYCKTYTYDAVTKFFQDPAGKKVDLSLAHKYEYIITDPFGNTTSGELHVYAGPIVSNGVDVLEGTYLGQGLYKKYCQPPSTDPLRCPDTNPRTSFVIGELKNGEVVGARYANNADAYIANVRLRDAYGNPVENVVGVKNVDVAMNLNSTLDFVSIDPNNTFQFGHSLITGLGDGYSLDYFGNSISPGDFSPSRPYTSAGDSIKIRSYAPSTAGTPSIPENDINISSLTVNVTKVNPYTNVGEGTYVITPMLKTSPLAFLPLASVTALNGFADIQMGRESLFAGTIALNDELSVINPGSAFAIHALTIGDGASTTMSTFQDLTGVTMENCSAFTKAGGTSVPGYVGYCSRFGNVLSSPASVITFPINIPGEQAFRAMPRRITEVELEQGYLYDSVIRYVIGTKEIIFPSLTATSVAANEQVFGNAVKIIGQKSGKNIFQTIVNTDQTTIPGLSRTETINNIRKNIGLLTRNVIFTTDTYNSSSLRVYKKDIVLNPQTELVIDGKRTIVAYGDITISDDLLNGAQANPLAIIALKNEAGVGGNIYIMSNVKRIDASLIAEGTIFSGEKSGTTRYYAQEPDAIDTLKNQLYIYGNVVSLNTIGGASLQSGSRCPAKDITCNNQNALIYDFEHLRYYRGGDPEAALLVHAAAALEGDEKTSSVIIEFNNELLKNPPPGIKNEN